MECSGTESLQFEVGMKPKPRPQCSQLELFQAQFEQLLSRYAHAKQFKRMRRKLKKLKTWLGRVVRRKVPQPDAALEQLLGLCERLHAQERTDSKKLYSLHEPDVMCISKGKAHQRYEFGQKVSVATTNRGNWIVPSICVKTIRTMVTRSREPLPARRRPPV